VEFAVFHHLFGENIRKDSSNKKNIRSFVALLHKE
jgi:hypothetical protein